MKITFQSKIFPMGIFLLFFVFIIFLAFSFNSCKSFGIPDWKLNITFEEGVDGTPDAGDYTYQELEVIEYNYYPIDDRHTIEVLVNGNRWSLAGQFVMYTNIDVIVRLFDIRDTWTITLKEDDSDSETEFNITFSGNDLLSGDFNDDRGFRGAWEITEDDLTFDYGNWQDYSFTGTVPTMSGTWSGAGKTGTWSAQRI